MATPGIEANTINLLQRSETSLKEYGNQAEFWKRIHFISRAAALLCSVLAAVAMAVLLTATHLAENGQAILKNASLSLPLLAAALIGLPGLFRVPRRWIAYRTASESLRSERFLYAAGAGKYAAGNRDHLFELSLQASHTTVGILLHGARQQNEFVDEILTSGPTPVESEFNLRGPIVPEEYRNRRFFDQLRWYRNRSREHLVMYVILVVLATSASIAAAAVEYFHLGAWLPVCTTMSAALSAYLAYRSDNFLSVTYRNTAHSLAQLWRTDLYEENFRNFVSQTEELLMREHSGWVAVMSYAQDKSPDQKDLHK